MSKKNNNIKVVIWLLVFILIAITTMALISISEEREEEKVEVPLPPNLFSSSSYVIGTGNPLGTYFPAGQILEKWFNDNLDKKGGAFKAFKTNGSVDNINLLLTKQIQFGMVEARIAKEAYFKNKKLRVVWPLWFDVVQMIKPPSDLTPNYVFPSDIKGFAGQKNSSTERTTKEIFESLDIKGNHFAKASTDKVLGMIGDARLGFAMIQAGIPNRTVSDSIIFYHCGLVNFTKEQIQLIKNNVSTSVEFTIPAGYYDENQPEINTIALPNILVTTSDTPADLVEYVTEMLIKGCPKLKGRFKAFETVPSNSDAVLKVLRETGVPFHEGSRRWLEKNSETLSKDGSKTE